MPFQNSLDARLAINFVQPAENLQSGDGKISVLQRGPTRREKQTAHMAPVANRRLAVAGQSLYGRDFFDESFTVNKVEAVHVAQPAKLVQREVIDSFHGKTDRKSTRLNSSHANI